MNRLKLIFAGLLMTAIVGVVPQAHAQTATLKVMIAGSSAMWQSMALAAYKGNATQGQCVSGGTAPCFHYTAKNFLLTDNRPTIKGGGAAVDKGSVWIVWDSNTTSTNVWAYIKVDSVVGNRCYFAQPQCTVSLNPFPGSNGLIAAALWGDNSSDSTPPSQVIALFTSGNLKVNVGATDIRPEDALFAQCRINSVLGGGPDGLAGLGYGINPSGTCPATGTNAQLSGNDILSGYPSSTATAHPLAFNISGHDPYSGTALPTGITTISVGASPIIFITQRMGALASITDATDAQLQAAFSGANCDASAFGGSGTIQVYLREPLSGTMNTTEYTVFRYPDFSGNSQETGVGTSNPLAGKPCSAGGKRFRAIGTGEEVNSVFNSGLNNGTDGIGYTFFSYGNVAPIAGNSNYGYLTLNGIDGIFHRYGATGIDPGQPSPAGVLPLTPPCLGGFPCAESSIWSGHLSFPNLRNGSYRAWSTLRIVSNGTALAAAKLLVTGSQAYVVNSVPDYVPALKVGTTDPGLALLRSHFTRVGVAPVNIATTGDKGGDEGGCILSSSGNALTSDTTTKLAQALPGTQCVSVP